MMEGEASPTGGQSEQEIEMLQLGRGICSGLRRVSTECLGIKNVCWGKGDAKARSPSVGVVLAN